MAIIKFKNILICIVLLVTNVTIAQSIKKIEPDSAKVGSNFFVLITGSGTHWQNSPNSKMEIYFNVTDIVNPGVTIQNDTTVRVKFYVAENAKLGVRKLILKYSSLDTLEYTIIDSSFTVYDFKK